MNTRLVTAALVAMLAAATAPAFIGPDEKARVAERSATGDPRVGACEPRCAPQTERQVP